MIGWPGESCHLEYLDRIEAFDALLTGLRVANGINSTKPGELGHKVHPRRFLHKCSYAPMEWNIDIMEPSKTMGAEKTYRKIVSTAASELDDLEALEISKRIELRRHMRRLARDRAAPLAFWIRKSGQAIFFPWLFLSVHLPSLSATFAASMSGSSYRALPSAFMGFAVGILLVVALIYYPGRSARPHFWDVTITRLFTLSSILFCASPFFHVGLHNSWTAFLLGISAAPTSFVLLTSPLGWVGDRWLRRRFKNRIQKSYYGSLAMSMIATASEIARKKDTWHSSHDARRVVAKIEDLATQFEVGFALRGRFSVFDRELNREMGEEANRLALLIRRHKKMIVKASCAKDYERVYLAMADGALLLFQNKRKELLLHAPNVDYKDRISQIARHVFPVAVLALAALFLPMIEPLASNERAVDGLRLTLLVAALLTFVSPRGDTSGRIIDALGKSIPIKPS